MNWLALGVVPYFLGVALVIVGNLRLRSASERSGLRLDKHGGEILSKSVNALPPVLDGSNKDQLALYAQRSDHPLARAILQALATWRPRNCHLEREFQARLLAKFKREMPEADPKDEHWIDSVSRIDLLLGDSALIEMKVAPGTTALDRAESQIKRYVRAWNRGPIILLVLRARADDIGQRVGTAIEELRQSGFGAVAVIGP